LRIGDDARVAFRISNTRRRPVMTVVCAWCQHQGRTTVLHEKEPFDRPVVSHGICEEHARAFLAELRETKTAGLALEPLRS
jgi:hypothetical protein